MGGGKDHAGTIAKDTFYLIIVALEQLAFNFICSSSFVISYHHTNFLGFHNPNSVFVVIESTYGDGPSEFVKRQGTCRCQKNKSNSQDSI